MSARDLTIAIMLALVMAILVAHALKLYPRFVWSVLWTYKTRPTRPTSGRAVAFIRYPLTPVAATCRCTGGTSSIVPAGLDDVHVCISCREAYTPGGQRLGYLFHIVRPEPRWKRLGKLIQRMSPWDSQGRPRPG